MTWDASIETDSKMHDTYHNEATKISTAAKPPHIKSVKPYGPKSLMFGIDRRAPPKWRKEAEKAIRIVMNAIGGSRDEILSRLWDEITDPLDPDGKRKAPRYKVYIYTEEDSIVSVLLAERVSKDSRGAECLNGSLGKKDELCECSPDKARWQTIIMTIDRIWTMEGYRKRGWATRLADFARQDFINGMTVPKAELAFSPTLPEGQEFATSYCKGVFEKASFLVDVEWAAESGTMEVQRRSNKENVRSER